MQALAGIRRDASPLAQRGFEAGPQCARQRGQRLAVVRVGILDPHVAPRRRVVRRFGQPLDRIEQRRHAVGARTHFGCEERKRAHAGDDAAREDRRMLALRFGPARRVVGRRADEAGGCGGGGGGGDVRTRRRREAAQVRGGFRFEAGAAVRDDGGASLHAGPSGAKAL